MDYHPSSVDFKVDFNRPAKPELEMLETCFIARNGVWISIYVKCVGQCGQLYVCLHTHMIEELVIQSFPTN